MAGDIARDAQMERMDAGSSLLPPGCQVKSVCLSTTVATERHLYKTSTILQ